MSSAVMKVGFEVDVPNLGSLIREARHASDKSITKLAAASDISVANWYAIEQERIKVLPVSTLRRIEEVLEIQFNVTAPDA